MKSSRTSARLALGLGLASGALGAAVPASAQAAATPSAAAGTSVARYAGSVEEAANNKAFFEAVVRSVAEKRAAQPNGPAVTVYYNASQAPSFRSQIASAASIWNSSESNVKLQEASSGADFSYYEGNDPRGSYASTNGHGGGYVFLDYAQNQQYDSVRVATHETGHVLGLPDDYSGPCSELMSGAGAGPSCTNPYPSNTERSRVDQLWATGPAQVPGTVDRPADPLSAVPPVRTVAPSHGPWHPLHSTPWR
ncbi:snapalysin [Streptomyces shenzhenensis]|uniref:Extracellular small neutral protease n=1 Tax=Streptomyces shenzhenensis TaxID=943815 RepID=A0A3M0HYS5_9ACTN|nr:snapalysin [Streptomyces shenzhenensis]RMB80852.1 ABC transporter substrate-binding protein [Streptomyces shenzhenensis]